MSLLHLVIWTLAIIFCIKAIKKFLRIYRNRKILSRIPGEPEVFFFGHLFSFVMCDPDDVLHILRMLSKKHWPIYRITTFFASTVNIMLPEDIEVVISGMKNLNKSVLYKMLEKWLGTGLLTSSGTKWQVRRKILTPAFHFSILKQFLQIFNDESKKMAKQFEEHVGKPFVNVTPLISQMTLQSINETAMGYNNVDENTMMKYKNAVYRIGQVFYERFRRPWLYIPHLYYKFTSLGKEELELVETLHNFTSTIINERENQFEENTAFSQNQGQNILDIADEDTYRRKRLAMLDLLLMAKNEGEKIDNLGIREEVDTFMFEGHDTTSSAISFMLFSLGYYKDIQTKVFTEIMEILGSNTKLPTYDDLQQLKYTERVIKETLRLYPSVPLIARTTTEEMTTVTGYLIPRNTLVQIHIFDLHRHPSIYPDPEKFDPDRFLPENSKNRHPYAYIPFSAGPRNCIGQKFAMLELKAVLCEILRRFEIQSVDSPSDLVFLPDIVLRTKNEIKVKFVKREY